MKKQICKECKEAFVKIINKMKLHNTSYENRVYNSALNELKKEVKGKC